DDAVADDAMEDRSVVATVRRGLHEIADMVRCEVGPQIDDERAESRLDDGLLVRHLCRRQRRRELPQQQQKHQHTEGIVIRSWTAAASAITYGGIGIAAIESWAPCAREVCLWSAVFSRQRRPSRSRVE